MENTQDLKTLFERIKTLDYSYFRIYPGEASTYPKYCDKDDKYFQGVESIVMGDDTEIRQVGPEKFHVFSYHDDDNFSPFEASADEVIAFYILQDQKLEMLFQEWERRDALNN